VVSSDNRGSRGIVPCAAKAPPVILCVISLRPGFMPNILAGVVFRFVNELSWNALVEVTDLGIFAAFEKRSDPNKSNIVIPHHAVLLFISREVENILKYCI